MVAQDFQIIWKLEDASSGYVEICDHFAEDLCVALEWSDSFLAWSSDSLEFDLDIYAL